MLAYYILQWPQLVAVKLKLEANILFDKGSQRSFISQKLANSLQLQERRLSHPVTRPATTVTLKFLG